MMDEQESNLSLIELLDLADERYVGIMIGSRDLSKKEVERIVHALRLAALVSVIATDAHS